MPQYIVGLDEFVEGQDIQHYGRLGMKWYKHIYGENDGRAKYLSKGLDKMGKMDNKVDVNTRLSTKYRYKATAKRDKAAVLRDKFEYTGKTKYAKKAAKLNKKVAKLSRKASIYDRRNAKLIKKGQKMAKFITKEYGSIKASDLSPDQIRTGKRACLDILEDRNRVA